MTEDYVAYCLELLAPLGAVRAKRMFGAHGVYLDGLFIAIVDSNRLYLKVDAETRPQFLAAGGAAFTYTRADGSAMSMAYHSPPDEALESPHLLQPWARLAWGAALRARNAKDAKAGAGGGDGAGTDASVAKRTSGARTKGASSRRAPRRP